MCRLLLSVAMAAQHYQLATVGCFADYPQYYTRRATSGEAQLHGLTPGLRNSEETQQQRPESSATQRVGVDRPGK